MGKLRFKKWNHFLDVFRHCSLNLNSSILHQSLSFSMWCWRRDRAKARSQLRREKMHRCTNTLFMFYASCFPWNVRKHASWAVVGPSVVATVHSQAEAGDVQHEPDRSWRNAWTCAGDQAWWLGTMESCRQWGTALSIQIELLSYLHQKVF